MKGIQTVKRQLTFEDAVRLAKEGEDIGMKSSNAARDVAKAQGGGRPPARDPAHGEGRGYKPHYHATGENGKRIGGNHIFYNIAAAFTLTYWAKECDCMKFNVW